LIVLLAGWSWYVPPVILEKNTVVGLHPSDLPEHAGGSPIQHQIIDGLVDSKMTLFELNEEYDRGYIIQKCDLDLRGSMKDIFSSLREAGTFLLMSFLKAYPKYEKHDQKDTKRVRKRLKPEDSELTLEKFSSMTARELYDFIRCREDPYPNVFVQDKTGRLCLKLVGFKSD
jgi:methionyl-tRNA formyltransferase